MDPRDEQDEAKKAGLLKDLEDVLIYNNNPIWVIMIGTRLDPKMKNELSGFVRTNHDILHGRTVICVEYPRI